MFFNFAWDIRDILNSLRPQLAGQYFWMALSVSPSGIMKVWSTWKGYQIQQTTKMSYLNLNLTIYWGKAFQAMMITSKCLEPHTPPPIKDFCVVIWKTLADLEQRLSLPFMDTTFSWICLGIDNLHFNVESEIPLMNTNSVPTWKGFLLLSQNHCLVCILHWQML